MTLRVRADTPGERCTATFAVRVLHGPPRPVQVVRVVGEIDRGNEDELRRATGPAHCCAAPRGLPWRPRCAPERPSLLVVDLRRARFVSSSVYAGLVEEGARRGQRVSLVAPPEGLVARTLRALDLGDELVLHDEILDAVLAEVVCLA